MIISEGATHDQALVPTLQGWTVAVHGLLEECRSGDVQADLGFDVSVALAAVGLCNLNLSNDLGELQATSQDSHEQRIRLVALLDHGLQQTEQALYRLYGLLLDSPGPWPARFRELLRHLLE